MRNTKKFLAVIMAATMVLGLAACGKTTSTSNSVSSASASKASASVSSVEEKKEEPPAPLKITVNLPSNALHEESDPNYDKLVQYINEYTNMDITWEWEDDKDGYYQNLELKFMSNDFRDVMRVGFDALFKGVAEENFWDVTDYIDDYDNLKTIPAGTRMACSINGRMYGIPLSRNYARNGWGIRQDWLDNLGLEMPTTWDEFVNVCDKFTHGDPDKNGVAGDTIAISLDRWQDWFWIPFAWFGVPNRWGIDANGELKPAVLYDEFKTALKEFRKLYQDGCIDPNFYEAETGDHNPGKVRNLLQTGKYGIGFQNLDFLRKVETYFESADVALSDPEDPIFTLSGYLDTGKGPLVMPTDGFNGLVAISKKNIKTEEQLRQVLGFLNDMCDGEMMNAVDYGFEGVTYDVVDGYLVLKSAEDLEAAGTSATFRNGFNQCIAYFTADENARPVDKEPANTAITILENKLYKELIPYCVGNYGAGYTSAIYLEKGAELDAMIWDIDNGMITKYITGQIDDAGLEEAINTWKAAGGEQYVKEMNESYKAAKH